MPSVAQLCPHAATLRVACGHCIWQSVVHTCRSETTSRPTTLPMLPSRVANSVFQPEQVFLTQSLSVSRNHLPSCEPRWHLFHMVKHHKIESTPSPDRSGLGRLWLKEVLWALKRLLFFCSPLVTGVLVQQFVEGCYLCRQVWNKSSVVVQAAQVTS